MSRCGCDLFSFNLTQTFCPQYSRYGSGNGATRESHAQNTLNTRLAGQDDQGHPLSTRGNSGGLSYHLQKVQTLQTALTTNQNRKGCIQGSSCYSSHHVQCTACSMNISQAWRMRFLSALQVIAQVGVPTCLTACLPPSSLGSGW